ncbi:MAG: Gfo/Idh/MocA family oxidoreductase [Halioglobus sp.]
MVRRPEPNLIRWGIIGPGRIAEEFVRALDAVGSASLYGVASRDKARAEKFASDYGASVYYDSYQALIEDPRVDAIYIATPHRFHYEQARNCILGGKPVLCEKPLTVNAVEARELIGLAQTSGVFLMEAMRTRYLPIYQQLRHWLDEGKIGAVSGVTSSFGFKFPRDPEDRLLNHELAGGALLDLGVYNLSMSQWLFAEPAESFSVQGLLGDTRVDEHDEITLVYPGARTSVFCISMTTELDNELTIYGDGGRITVHPMFWNATQATLSVNNGLSAKDETRTVRREFFATGMEYEIEEAVRCIQDGLTESSRMPLSDTLDTMMLMDQLRSAMGLAYDFE